MGPHQNRHCFNQQAYFPDKIERGDRQAFQCKEESNSIVVPCADQSLVKNLSLSRSQEFAPRKRGDEPTGNNAEMDPMIRM